MSRRQFLGAAAGAAASTLPGPPAEAGLPSRSPNIVVLFSDQQRWDTLSCSEHPVFPGLTPNIDRLAAEGVRFRNAYTCQPVCGPARSCILTGRYATETGCYVNGIPLRLDERTVAHRLGEAGYRTAYVGKWHLASGQGESFVDRGVPPERRGGFKDYWVASDVLEFTSHAYDGHMYDSDMRRVDFPPNRYRADCVTDFALDFLRAAETDRPFFLFVSYIEPHHQNDHQHFEGPTGSKERYARYTPPGDLLGLRGNWQQELPDYLGCCASLDANVGRVRQELERRGLFDNTLLIYTSDHGCHFRTRNGEYKRSCHEACTHIPLIARGPGFRGGRTVDPLVSLIDVPATLLSAGNVPRPRTVHGRPLQPLAGGRASRWPQEVFMQISESEVGRAVRTSRWTYAVRAPGLRGGQAPGSDVYEEEYLYDLVADPVEHENLVRDPAHAEIRRQLAETLKRRMRDAGEKVPEIRPAPAA